MHNFKYWALRTSFLIGQAPAALALMAFVIVWSKIGHISYALGATLMVILLLNLAFVQILVRRPPASKPAVESDNAGSPLS